MLVVLRFFLLIVTLKRNFVFFAMLTCRLVAKAVNREDKQSRRYRDRDFAKFERSRRYRDR